MSNNPFATPTPLDAGPARKVMKKAPGGLTALLIISLVLAILGLLGSCMGAGALVFQQVSAGGGQLPGQQAMQKEIEKIQKDQMIPNIITIGLNFVVAPLLMLGAIGCLNRQTWGHRVLGIGLMLAMLYTVVKTVISVISQVAMMEPMKKIMEAAIQQQGKVDQQAADMMGSLAYYWIIFVVVITVVWSLILFGFYFWGWNYLRRDSVKEHFGVTTVG